jgi:hypothetical protein
MTDHDLPEYGVRRDYLRVRFLVQDQLLCQATAPRHDPSTQCLHRQLLTFRILFAELGPQRPATHLLPPLRFGRRPTSYWCRQTLFNLGVCLSSLLTPNRTCGRFGSRPVMPRKINRCNSPQAKEHRLE